MESNNEQETISEQSGAISNTGLHATYASTVALSPRVKGVYNFYNTYCILYVLI